MNSNTNFNNILTVIKNHENDLMGILNYLNNNDISLGKNDIMSVILPNAIDNKVSKEIIRYFLNICGKNNFLEYSIQNMNEKQVKHITKFFVFDNNFILKLLNMSKNGEVMNNVDINKLINKEINIPSSLYQKILSLNEYKILDILIVFENSDTLKKLNDEYKILIKAVENNSLNTIKILYKKGIDLNEKQFNRTALSLASFYGFEEIVKFLVDKVENLNDKNNFYQSTPLFIALKKKHYTIVPILLKSKKIDIEEKDNNGNTALVLAVKYGNLDIVKTLINYGADVNTTSNNGKPLLIIATIKNYVDIANYLIQNGSDVNKLDNNGNSALSIAIRCQFINMIKILIKHGATIEMKDSSNNSSLLTGLLTDNEELYSYLLNRCNNINIKNYDDKTALNIFTEREDLDKIKLLIYYGADINSKDIYGNTPLLIAINKKNVNIINYLIDNGADINIKDKDGNTPLIIATKRNFIECCEKLINNDANVNCKDINGNSPLMIAIRNEKLDIAKLLINDSYINEENKFGESPLSLAVNNNSMDLIKLLVKNGANINYKYKNKGETIIMKAFDSYNRKKDIIKYLINEGGNINEINSEGHSILSEICKNRHSCLQYDKEKLDFLIKNNAEVTNNIFFYNKDIEYYLKKNKI